MFSEYLSGFMPHGHCYLWRKDLLSLHVFSDLLIGLSYLLIPFFMFLVIKRKKNFKFRKLFILYISFIVMCGITHLFEIITVWYPEYYISGLLKAITALVSVSTTVYLFRNIQSFVNLPDKNSMDNKAKELKGEVKRRSSLEKELYHINSQLEQKVEDRTRALDEKNQLLESYINWMSHDLKEPLRNIISFNNLLSDSKLSENQLKYSNWISKSSQRMKKMIQSILDHSSLKESKISKREFSLDELFDECIDIHAKEEIKVIKSIKRDKINTDETQLKHVFLNLITNSLKFKRDNIPLVIKFESFLDESCHLIVFEDNGIGIDEKNLNNIFDPFFSYETRHNDTGRSTGLGLTIIKNIITRLDGDINVESEQGEYSRFVLILPYDQL